MANTFTKIASVSVDSSGASSMSFTSIPNTYTDLCLFVSARSSRSQSSDNIDIFFNGSTSNRSDTALRGSGGVTVSYTTSNGHIGYIPAASDTSNTFGSTFIYIPNYTSSNNKSFSADVVMENNASGNGSAFMVLDAGLWSQTAAITSITINTSSGASSNFVQYSTATLYGIKNS
jgi:hypothetical protein